MILEELLKPMAHEATLQAYEREKTIRQKYGEGFIAKPILESSKAANLPKTKAGQKLEIPGRIIYSKESGKDIYGNEKSAQTKYFECPGCKRKVASSRFAAHIERCLSGRNARKNKNPPGANGSGDSTTSTTASSPDGAKKVSPQKKRKTESKLSEKITASLPASRTNSPAAVGSVNGSTSIPTDPKRPSSTL